MHDYIYIAELFSYNYVAGADQKSIKTHLYNYACMVIRPVHLYSNFSTYYSNYLFTLDQPNIQLHQPIIQIDDTYYSTYTAAK